MNVSRLDFERFVSKIEKTDSCWIWKGNIDSLYGRFTLNGKRVGAHRLSYEIFNDFIPNGLEIDHLCNNTVCVNPKHLEAVTRKENNKRMFFNRIPKTHCINGHKFTSGNIYIDKLGKRMCRTCRNVWSRTWRIKNSSYVKNYNRVRYLDRIGKS